jgi:hypothetical protein
MGGVILTNLSVFVFVEDKIKILEETNVSLGDKAKSLRLQLESEREQNVKNQDLVRRCSLEMSLGF